ncbi:RNA polymerase II transcription factor [Pseudozyma hubeiensis]|nr:RNA polymerase II transcription factor [Pseudozyma hubeiensis]
MEPGATNGVQNGEDEDDEAVQAGVDLLQMAFRYLLPAHAAPTLCACHSRSRGSGYLCPRCGVKVCDVPTDCPVCGITIVMSTHLARSYHHLFPVPNWKAVPWTAVTLDSAPACSRATCRSQLCKREREEHWRPTRRWRMRGCRRAPEV